MTGGCTGFDRAGDRQGRSGRPAWPRATPDRVAGERNEGVQVARKPTWSKLDLDGASLRALRPPAMADYGCMVQEGVGGEQGRNANLDLNTGTHLAIPSAPFIGEKFGRPRFRTWETRRCARR